MHFYKHFYFPDPMHINKLIYVLTSLALLGLSPQAAVAFPVTIKYEFTNNGTTITLPIPEDHVRGEIPSNGIQIYRPLFIHLDQDLKLTDGITEATRFRGKRGVGLRYAFSPSGPSGENLSFDSGHSGVFFKDTGDDIPAETTSGTITWIWNLEPFTAPPPDWDGGKIWDRVPEALSSNSVIMTAHRAGGFFGSTEYMFVNVTDPTHSSGWQTDRNYLDSGLKPATTYSYKVKARNADTKAETPLSLAMFEKTFSLKVTVESDFGADKITPRAYLPFEVAEGTEVTFRAPDFVYLDRNFDELEGISDEALYRARRLGYSVDGENIQGTEGFFQKRINDNVVVVWIWELEYALIIESPAGAALGNAVPAVSKHWYKKDTLFSAAIDSAVADEGAGVRLSAYGYKAENARSDPASSGADRFWRFPEESSDVGAIWTDKKIATALAPPAGGATPFTIELWAKLDGQQNNERDQPLLSFIRQERSFPDFYGPIPQKDNETWQAGTYFGVRSNGRLFIEEVKVESEDDLTPEYQELAVVPAALVGSDWHHWAFVFEDKTITIYRDGSRVFHRTLAVVPELRKDPHYTKIYFGINVYKYEVRDGSKFTTFRTVDRLIGSLNNFRFFDEARTESQIRDSIRYSPAATGQFEAVSDKTLTDNDINFVDLLAGDRKTTVEINGYSYVVASWREHELDVVGNLDPSIAAGQDYAIYTSDSTLKLAFEFANNAPPPVELGAGTRITALPFDQAFRNVLRDTGTAVDERAVDSVGDRIATEEFTIQDWLKITWLMKGQVRYRFDAASGQPGESNERFDGQSFVRIYDEAGDSVEEPTYFGSGPNKDVWIDTGRKIDVGAFYRTTDRRFTLADFVAPTSGDLGSLGSDISGLTDTDTIPDAQGNKRVSRIFTVSKVSAPTEIHWHYQPTVFRAEIPLGTALDRSQLVPPLPVDAVLSDAGPAEDFLLRVGELPTGRAAGNPVRWDQVDKKLYPVQPGSTQTEWPDMKIPGRSYRIEVVSGYPGDTVTLASERELPDAPYGRREGSPPEYVLQTTLERTAESFPAHSKSGPDAHYHHLFDPVPGRRPPTKLDLSATDEWKFQELTYTDATTKAVADKAAVGTPFSSQGAGRSVLLYSYRPNPDEAADGNLDMEKLAVRVVRSAPIVPILPDDKKFVLGRRGLALGGGDSAVDGAVGVIAGSPSEFGFGSASEGVSFIIDFWLNAKNLSREDDDQVTVLSMGDQKLDVTLDGATSTITVDYFDLKVTQPFSRAGAAWRHYVIHVFEDRFSGIPVTLLDLYIDGVRAETGVVSAHLQATPTTVSVAPGLTADSLTFGAGADPEDGLQLDQFRLFVQDDFYLQTWLTPTELRDLRTDRDAIVQGGLSPRLLFDFDTAPAGNSFKNEGSLRDLADFADLGVGPVPVDPAGIWPRFWARLDIQEVATRLDSTLDNAGFGGSGYVVNAVSNYNAKLYDREAEVGAWGPVFPVNHGQLYRDAGRRLEVAYYENPFLVDPLQHPNVAWPYEAAAYDEVIYPAFGPHKNKAIYIASRIGSEGVDQTGRPQQIFDLAGFSDLTIYHQPDDALPGFNPNEEHALVAASGRAALKITNLGDDIANNPPLAAFALQADINATSPGYTSDPWVLVQVNNLLTGEPEMSAYQVFKTRDGNIAFPRPAESAVNATDGLAYQSAAARENRFLTLEPDKSYDFDYQFDYPVFAGDLLIPPYPLNLVIGNITMLDERGGNIQVNGVNQRTLWRDVNHRAWVASGGGRFFHQFFYPFRDDFFFPSPVNPGTPVAWLPQDNTTFTGDGASLEPVRVIFNSSWRSNYPKLKRGETLTYQGGEYFNENPGSNGLPALVAMKAAEVVFDVATPDMVINDANLGDYSARVIRPLDRHETPFTVAQMGKAKFTPAAQDKIFIVAERWYFKALPGSLQRRFYFDSLAEKLVFRGFLNDKDSDDPDLTTGPDPLNILEPNVMTSDDYALIRSLSTDTGWITGIESMFLASQNPHGVTDGNASASSPVYLSGVKDVPVSYPSYLTEFWRADLSGRAASPDPTIVHLDSFGVGSALVPSPNLLRQSPTGSRYVTIAENNRSELDGAPVSLHIIEIIPDRYRGAIKVIEPVDAFSEKITLQHNGEFGANTGDLYYEWWLRDAAPLDDVAQEVLDDGTLKQTDEQGNSLWQQYIPDDRAALTDEEARHLGLHSIVFEGRPDVTLADKLVLMRYRHKDEDDWRLVPFEFSNPAAEWQPGTPAPFQWAGAANSPQLQPDGSKYYIPQLVMGWVKRVLDRINPYEARYTNFFSNESPAPYSSQIQIAGAPFAGKVALNPDKNVIENTGLIELYETVLTRARELSIDNSSNAVSTGGINQALLLAATRLAVLYELLAREAYSDVQDSTITVANEDGLANVASFTHVFQNSEADLLHEELALLRGTDFRKSYPVYNRLFWNYAKGLGEAAYNVNYNIYDENTDGFINEDDARSLYPQGHGDAWGHFVSALGMHYKLLQHKVFSWKTRPELYTLMQNVLEVDYLDEKTFAKLAAGKARAGRDIVRGTYRLHYTQNPDGQWQGYTDGADPARAWGVSEWAHRAGQAAYFDWAVANSLLPDEAPGEKPENLDRIERLTAIDEIGEIAGGLYEIQTAMDEANGGVNPLGFDSDAITFDLYPRAYDGGVTSNKTHFEQIYERAVAAGNNAMATLGFAGKAGNKLRRVADDTDALIVEAFRQDLDYRNRLIEIFGRPYDGTIGFGKPFPEGYEGPDTLFFGYLDRTTIDQIVPQLRDADAEPEIVHFENVYASAKSAMDNRTIVNLYANVHDSGGPDRLKRAFETLVGKNDYETEQGLDFPVSRTAAYAFLAPQPDWGRRTSYGKVQRLLEEMLREEIALDSAVIDYQGFLQDWEVKTQRLMSEIELLAIRGGIASEIVETRKTTNGIITGIEIASSLTELSFNNTVNIAQVAKTAPPLVNGFSNDLTSGIRAVSEATSAAAKGASDLKRGLVAQALKAAGLIRDELINDLEREIGFTEKISEIEGMVESLVNLSGSDQPKRDTIATHLQNLEIKRQEYFTAQAEGFRLQREREAFNKILAAKVQKNRYQDMIFRLSRNEAMTKYRSAFDHAARYAWLAAKAYDYETSLDPGHPAAAGALLDKIVKQSQLGLWTNGQPQAGQGGLAEMLNHLNGNFQVLKGQLGLNNPKSETEKISLRSELFRIGPGASSDDRWEEAIKARIEPDLNRMPAFVRCCRPFANPADGPQPGIVIRFSTSIEPGRNVFGVALAPGDHNYSTANFAIKVRGFGVWLGNYNAAGLSTTPRAYLVPVGNDYMRVSTSAGPMTHRWSVQEQRIPTPFTINQSDLISPGFIPMLNGVDGGFSELRRHGDFRMYHDEGGAGGAVEESELILDSRLVGRSVWNSEWLLIIPGAGLHVDPNTGLRQLAEKVSDIKLHFKTYSHQGQ